MQAKVQNKTEKNVRMLKKYALLACILALLPLVAAHASVEGSLPDVVRRLLTHIDSLAVKGLLISGMLMPMMTVFNRNLTELFVNAALGIRF